MALTTYETLAGGIARIAVDRPEKRNAMSPAVRGEIFDHVGRAAADEAVAALLLGSSGGHFCAGGDIDAMTETTPEAARARMQASHRLVAALHDCEKPVVAAVEGYAVGAGASLALLADLIVVADGATIGFPFLRLGLVPDFGLFYTLPRRVGAARARRLLLLAAMVRAEEAVAIGLADERVPAGEAERRGAELAAELAAMPPHALGLAKRQLTRFPTDLAGALEMEAMAQALCFGGAEFREGRAAFAEKRKPDFRGRGR